MTLARRPAAAIVALVLSLPVLIGLGAAWKQRLAVGDLAQDHAVLELENASYRAATDALADQIAALESAIIDINASSSIDTALVKSVIKLPALVKARAMGDTEPQRAGQKVALPSILHSEATFGLMRDHLKSIELRLSLVRTAVDRGNALATATPSMWPMKGGWLSSGWGLRTDPIRGGQDFHSGLDIVGDRGQAVFATASGTVSFSGHKGAYGNMVTVDHGFGLQTRYGHLLRSHVRAGDTINRGNQIGQVGATGRATGFHLHYEVLANGRLLNPIQLLTQESGSK